MNVVASGDETWPPRAEPSAVGEPPAVQDGTTGPQPPPLTAPADMVEYGVRVLANQVPLSYTHKKRVGINTICPDRTPPALNAAQCML